MLLQQGSTCHLFTFLPPTSALRFCSHIRQVGEYILPSGWIWISHIGPWSCAMGFEGLPIHGHLSFWWGEYLHLGGSDSLILHPGTFSSGGC
jgi:hypothetical protein